MSVGSKFLTDRNITMIYEKFNWAGDHVQVSGFYDTYKIKLTYDKMTTVEILVEYANTAQVSDIGMIIAMSITLGRLEQAQNFEEWCGKLSGYDGDQVSNKNWAYLWRLYHYLVATKAELEKVFSPGDMQNLEDFYFEYVSGVYGYGGE